MNPLANLSPKQLRQAADIQERIQSLQEQLEELLGVPGQAPSTPAAARVGAPNTRKRSAATIARMRKAQKERWARIKGGAQAEPAGPDQKPKRRFTAAGRAALAKAAKERWRKAKAEGRSRL